MAGRLGSGLPAHVDEGDLVSYGLLGLIGAIERYDPTRDIKFETYAIARIKGAIIDELRALDWVPRSVRSRAREIERAIAELEAKTGLAPTDEQIAAKIGISVDELEESLTDISPLVDRRARRALVGLGRRRPDLADGHDRGRDRPAARGRARRRPRCARRSPTRSPGCPEREKLVVTLYYYEELTLREIGEVLGVTESRVSQLHTKAILRLKARLAGAAARV